MWFTTRARIRCELRILGQRRKTGGRTEAAELIVVADCQKELTISRGERVVRSNRRVTIPDAPRSNVRGQMHRCVITEDRNDAVEHTDVDLLSATGLLARIQREHDPVGGQHACYQIGDRDADAKRRAVRIAGDAHEATLGLNDRVVASLESPGPVCPKPEIDA